MNRHLRIALLTATGVGILATSLAAGAQPPPGFTVTPTFLAFQDQAVNQASPSQPVTLTNGLDTPVAISSITLSGSSPENFSFSGNCGSALEPLASCQEDVVFQPLSIGVSSATLVVNNDAGAPQQVTLLGNGTAAIVQITPSVIATIPVAGPGGTVQLNAPTGIFRDPFGNLFVADRGNNVIREIDTAGSIFTFAGNGTAGFSGDGGPATAAQLNSPSDITFDSAGNAYIADQQNQRIRIVTSQGTISTFAGTGAVGYTGDDGPANQATFNFLSSIASDGFGDLVIADQRNNVLRSIDRTGTISTIAGTGVAGYGGDGGSATRATLNLPSYIRFDQNGNGYIADQGNHVVRQLGNEGQINTFAGNGTAGSTGDGGPATQAELSNPDGLGLDQSGDLYISDSASNNVRKVDTFGTITTVAGNGTAGYTGDNGPATVAQLNGPAGIAVDLPGNLYVADSLNNVIRKVGPAGALAFPNTNVFGVSSPQLLLFVNIGNVSVTLPPSSQWTPTGSTSDYRIAGECANGPTLAPNGACTLQVTFTPTAAGIRTLTYSIADSAIGAPQQVQLSGTGVPLPQTITFPRIPNHIVGDPPFALNATVSSELPVAYTVVSGPATVEGALVTLTGAGTVVIQADQAGDTIFAPASPVQQTFSVLGLTSISPNSAIQGSPATTITLTGAGFATSDLVQLNGATLATTFASTTSLTAIVPATFLAQLGTGSISVFDTSIQRRTAALSFTVIIPPVQLVLTGPTTSPSGQQPTLTFQLVNPYPAPLIGTFNLAFQPDPKVNVDDPSIQFSGGGRAFNFGIPANSTVTPTVQIQTGTVAGTAVISLQVTANGINVTPGNLAPVVINIPEAAPVLNSVAATRSGDTITIAVQGFSNTREVTQAKFHFAGETFKNPDITIDVTTLFANWYSNETSLQFGSSFRYTQSFTLSSNAANVKTVTVTLDNSIGTSTAIIAQ